MANTAALLQNLLRCKADYNYAILQQSLWASKQEANLSKLSAHQSSEEDWYKAYDKAEEVAFDGDAKDLKYKGQTYVKAGCNSTLACENYANAKVGDFDEISLNLDTYSDLDTEYSLMLSTYDAMVTQLDAMITSYEEELGSAAADTGRIGQG